MEKCTECGGSGECQLCHGTGLVKINPHPSPEYTKTDGSGTSKCLVCKGTGVCFACKRSGRKK